MPIIEVNDQEVEFPDNMSLEEIKAVLQKKIPHKKEKKPALDYGMTMLDQGLQGLSFGVSDEMADRVAARLAQLITGKPHKKLLEQARADSQGRLKQQMEDTPALAVGSNIVGALAAGGASATTKAGAVIGNLLRSGNAASRVGKGAFAGSASGGLYGAGTGSEEENENTRFDSARRGALFGSFTGAATPILAHAASRVLTKKPLIPKAEDVKKLASMLYQKADRQGGVLSADFSADFIKKIQKLRPQTEIGIKLSGEEDYIQVIATLTKELDGKRISLQTAQDIDEYLGSAVDKFIDQGRLTKPGKHLQDIQDIFRTSIERAKDNMVLGGKESFQTLKEARKLWSTSRKLSDIERIVQRAELMDHPATGLKTGFRTLLGNPNRLRGYSTQEVKALKKAAQTGVLIDALRTIGSKLNPIVAFGASGSPTLAGSTYLGSSISKDIATKIQMDKAQRLAEVIAGQGALSAKNTASLGSYKYTDGISSAGVLVPGMLGEALASYSQSKY